MATKIEIVSAQKVAQELIFTLRAPDVLGLLRLAGYEIGNLLSLLDKKGIKVSEKKLKEALEKIKLNNVVFDENSKNIKLVFSLR